MNRVPTRLPCSSEWVTQINAFKLDSDDSISDLRNSSTLDAVSGSRADVGSKGRENEYASSARTSDAHHLTA